MGICRFVVVGRPTKRPCVARRATGLACELLSLFTAHGIHPVQSWPAEFDAMAEAGLAFAGSPASVANAIGRQLIDTGANYCVGQFVFGDMSREECRRSIDLFSSEVIPAITGKLAAA